MTRRRRLLILVIAVLVGVPVLAVVGVGSYLRSGGLEREIEHAWIARGMPGRLMIGSVRLAGLDGAVAEDVTLVEDGQQPLVKARRIAVTFDLIDGRLLNLRVDGARGALDVGRFNFLRDIIHAEQLHPPTRAPKPVLVEVADGEIDLPGGLKVTGAAVRVNALGPHAEVEGAASLSGRPLRVAVTTDRASPEAPIVTSVVLQEINASPAAILAAVEGIGLISHLPDGIIPWLPGLVDGSGTTFQIDVVSNTFRGLAKAVWGGGKASCEIDADARRVTLRRLSVDDQRLGGLDGQAAADRAGSWLSVDANAWKTGPGLPIPNGLPLSDMAKLLPELQVRWPTSDRRTSVALVGPGRARLEIILGGNAPPRLNAAELPLVMAQGLLPKPLLLGGGHVVTASAVLNEGRPEFSAEVRQARMLAEGWSFGPLDGMVAAVVTAGGGVQVSTRLPIGPEPGTTISFNGGPTSGKLTVECPAIDALLTRLRGPIQLPDLTGRLDMDAEFTVEPQQVQVKVARLELSSAVLRLLGRDFARDISAKMSGGARVGKDLVEVDLGGHLRSGELRIPDEWLSLAARTPLFSLEVTATMHEGQVAELSLRRAMVRAADAAGEPTPGGYSAQLEGKLSGERLNGRVVGIVDHADLAWLTSRIVPGHVQVSGEGAVAFQSDIAGGEVRRIDGTFLPLGADLDVERGKLRVGGITGGIRFILGGDTK
jgi:hypothetical protein